MKLKVDIHNLKCIEDLTIELPLERGLYAITGQNGSGKSTIVTCASSAFYELIMIDHFGDTDDDAYIHLTLGLGDCTYKKVVGETGKKWWKRIFNNNFKVNGFYEGSLIYGNRFRNTDRVTLRRLNKKKPSGLKIGDEFIRKNLGYILQGDEEYYSKLYFYKDSEFKNPIFYYEKNGHMVNQFYMSTGENLLISILYSLLKRINDTRSLNIPCLILLDEIELAMHPSALKRLTSFMRKIADDNDFAIYFSTHSLEVIASISPNNIFYVNRHIDNSYEIVNPCYHAYATRILYDHEGYDKVFLVEDILAKTIIDRIMTKERLKGNKLVHIMPAGGFSNVIDLAYDVVKSNLLSKKASVAMILDRDIKDKAINHKRKIGANFNVPMSFLPVESLEKYLKKSLVTKVNHALHRELSDYIFSKNSLESITHEYKKNIKNDEDGKKLFSILMENVYDCGKNESDLVEIVIEYFFKTEPERIIEITDYLKNELS